MVQSFSPSDICIWVRFDKYNTINRSCSGGGRGEERGRGGERREERGKGRKRKGRREGRRIMQWEKVGVTTWSETLRGYPCSVKLSTNLTMHETQLDGRNTITCTHYKA